jgi:hypothetical protein
MKKILYIIALGCFIASCEKKHNDSTEAVKDSTALSSPEHAGINKDSCSDGVYIKYPHAYNNYIIDNQAYIVEKNIRFVKALERNDTEDKAGAAYTELKEQTQHSLDSLERLCPFNGNTEFKASAIELFKFYQEAWTQYETLIGIKDKKERVKNYEKVKTHFNEIYAKKEKELEDKFITAHTNFSNEYMLHVRKTPLHEKLDSLLYLKK